MQFTSSHRHARRAFTLIEMLVVIGIIALLIAILVPTIMGSVKRAKKVRTAADMQTIRTALDAYKADFGDYPRPEPGETDDGFAVLGRALFSPGGVKDLTKSPPVLSAPTYVSQAYGAGSCVAYNTAE